MDQVRDIWPGPCPPIHQYIDLNNIASPTFFLSSRSSSKLEIVVTYQKLFMFNPDFTSLLQIEMKIRHGKLIGLIK